jgi:hypothetical protein
MFVCGQLPLGVYGGAVLLLQSNFCILLCHKDLGRQGRSRVALTPLIVWGYNYFCYFREISGFWA